MAAGRGVGLGSGIARRQPSAAGRRGSANLPRRWRPKPQTKQLWVCTSCGFIYDPDEGDPDGGIPPGTPFDDIPDDWFCPVCGARKADFEPYAD